VEWSRTGGGFRRVPLGVTNLGKIAATGEAVVVKDVGSDYGQFLRPDWARREGIRGFNGQPIIHRGETLGVLAIYTRIPTPEAGPGWVRVFADHIAAALVNARAFEEIERLKSHLELENLYLREEVEEAKALGGILGRSDALRQAVRRIDLVAPTDATVLILGESGTGKELVAREIHRRSQRHDQPLIRVNCASVPRELYESEFFGHIKGAFTGALKDRAGRFEAADQGTLFLDEVGEIPWDLQSKFLRVLQEKQYERVGEERTRTVDVRIIAATNRELEQEIAKGRFRQDLFYRLNVFPIEVPPLRRRREDIVLLAEHFLDQAARRLRLAVPRLNDSHRAQLEAYDWPGNVRELQNVVERAVILSRSGALHLDVPLTDAAPLPVEPTAPATPRSAAASTPLSESQLREFEKANLLAALERCAWKIHGPDGAASLMGIKPTTLFSRIKRLGLQRPRGALPAA